MRTTLTFYHLFFALLLISSIVIMILYVPPEHVGIIILLISLLSFTAFYITALITQNRNTRVLIGAFIALFLGMNAAIGFSLINTVLLVSFIIGLKFILK